MFGEADAAPAAAPAPAVTIVHVVGEVHGGEMVVGGGGGGGGTIRVRRTARLQVDRQRGNGRRWEGREGREEGEEGREK